MTYIDNTKMFVIKVLNINLNQRPPLSTGVHSSLDSWTPLHSPAHASKYVLEQIDYGHDCLRVGKVLEKQFGCQQGWGVTGKQKTAVKKTPMFKMYFGRSESLPERQAWNVEIPPLVMIKKAYVQVAHFVLLEEMPVSF